MEDLAKNGPFEGVARKGIELYERIKNNYEPSQNGRFLALEVDSEKTYTGESTAEALEKARAENPGKLFYVVKIGFTSAETLAHSVLHRA